MGEKFPSRMIMRLSTIRYQKGGIVSSIDSEIVGCSYDRNIFGDSVSYVVLSKGDDVTKGMYSFGYENSQRKHLPQNDSFSIYQTRDGYDWDCWFVPRVKILYQDFLHGICESVDKDRHWINGQFTFEFWCPFGFGNFSVWNNVRSSNVVLQYEPILFGFSTHPYDYWMMNPRDVFFERGYLEPIFPIPHKYECSKENDLKWLDT